MSNPILNDQMWDHASRDHDAEHQRSLLSTASVAAAPVWGFLVASESESDFHNRLALMESQIHAVARSVATEGSADYIKVVSGLPERWFDDWQVAHGARRKQASDDFWAAISDQLARVRKCKTVHELLEILAIPGDYPAINAYIDASVGDGFFAGSGGDDSLYEALRDAGWVTLWAEAVYHYALAAPGGGAITYVEGDVYQGNERSNAKKAIHVDFDDEGEDVEHVLLLPPEGEGVSHWTPPPKRAAHRKTSMALRDFAFEKGIDAAALVEAMQALNPEFPKQKRNWGEIALQTLMDMQFPTDWLELAAQSMMQVVGNSYGSANSWGEEHWHNTRGHTGLPRDPHALLDDYVARSSQAVASAPRSVPRRPVGGDLGRLAASRAFRRIAAEVVADVPPAQSESKPPEGADVDIATIEIGQVITDEVDGKTHSYTVTDVADQGESVLVSVTKDDGETMDLDIPKSEKVHVTSDSFGAPEESETPAQEKAKEKAEKKNKSSDSKSKKDKSSDEDEDEDEDSEDSSEDDDKGKKKAALGELTKAIEALTTLANQYLPENNPYVDGGDVLDEPLAEVAPPPPPAPPADPEPVETAPLVEPAGDGTVTEV